MRIGIPTEVKNNENRVAITPSGVDMLVRRGHSVVIESNAGVGSRISDDIYRQSGAAIVDSAEQVWGDAELILKVKEPIPSEFSYLRYGQTVFTYLHLAANPELTNALLASGVTAIAYETVQLADRSLPLLAPMSEIAGRLSVAVGSNFLMKSHGGSGTLLGGIAGTPRARAVIIGGGVAGEHAAAVALGMGASVTVLDISLPRLRDLQRRYDNLIETRISTPWEIGEQLASADLVVGSVLVPGRAAPKLVTKEMVAAMNPGAILVDIAIDQGGCFEGSRPTTHDSPTFSVHEALYYCVANMPGAVPVTATRALTNATLPYVVALADKGVRQALDDDDGLAQGLNVDRGSIRHKALMPASGEAAS
jgi:alanine dehydrogenase